MQIAHQRGVVGFERVVRRVMQLHAVCDLLFPPDRAHGIKHRGELAAGFRKIGGLRGGWGPRALKKMTLSSFRRDRWR